MLDPGIAIDVHSDGNIFVLLGKHQAGRRTRFVLCPHTFRQRRFGERDADSFWVELAGTKGVQPVHQVLPDFVGAVVCDVDVATALRSGGIVNCLEQGQSLHGALLASTGRHKSENNALMCSQSRLADSHSRCYLGKRKQGHLKQKVHSCHLKRAVHVEFRLGKDGVGSAGLGAVLGAQAVTRGRGGARGCAVVAFVLPYSTYCDGQQCVEFCRVGPYCCKAELGAAGHLHTCTRGSKNPTNAVLGAYAHSGPRAAVKVEPVAAETLLPACVALVAPTRFDAAPARTGNHTVDLAYSGGAQVTTQSHSYAARWRCTREGAVHSLEACAVNTEGCGNVSALVLVERLVRHGTAADSGRVLRPASVQQDQDH